MTNGGSIEELAVELLGKTADSLSRAERRVLESIHRREVTSRDLGVTHGETSTFGQRLADHVAAIGGSWGFIIGFALVLFAWMLLNSKLLASLGISFDPYPFIFLNLMLSMLAAFQAPIIMMSQNRQAARDKHESIIDFAINYKAEQEIDDMQKHLHRMEAELAEIKELLRERE